MTTVISVNKDNGVLEVTTHNGESIYRAVYGDNVLMYCAAVSIARALKKEFPGLPLAYLGFTPELSAMADKESKR